MQKELEVFIDFLKKKDLKLTRQREEILTSFIKIDRHLSVEDLYNVVKNRDSSIGQATVFRTLKLLCDANVARVVDLGDKMVRYEHKYGHEHHDHLVCVKCGKSIEVVDPEIERLQGKLCKKFSFLANKHILQIFGICKQCKNKIKNPNRRKG